jgi:hypothetical protein
MFLAVAGWDVFYPGVEMKSRIFKGSLPVNENL